MPNHIPQLQIRLSASKYIISKCKFSVRQDLVMAQVLMTTPRQSTKFSSEKRDLCFSLLDMISWIILVVMVDSGAELSKEEGHKSRRKLKSKSGSLQTKS